MRFGNGDMENAQVQYIRKHYQHHTLTVTRQCESVVRATIKVNGKG